MASMSSMVSDSSDAVGLGGDALLEEGLGAPVQFATQPFDGDACDPRWDFEACFRYQATGSELTSRRIVLTFYHRSWPFGTPVHFGTCQVSLMDIATGPNKYDLPIKGVGGAHAGRIVFSVQMVQQCGLSIVMPQAMVKMRALARHTSQASLEAAHRESSYFLSASLTMGESESTPTRAEFDSRGIKFTEKAQVQLTLPEADKLEPRIALLAQASARAFDSESMHLCVWENATAQKLAAAALTLRRFGGGGSGKQRLLGEVWLPVTKVHAPSDRSHKRVCECKFDEVLWLHGHRVGRLSGTVRIINGPSFIQLPGGFFTEQGIVPVGPIAAGAAGGMVGGNGAAGANGDASPALMGSPASLLASAAGQGSSASLGGSSSLDFEQPPKGLQLPKEVDLLVSLVQSLRKVVLDLHLDASADVRASADHVSPDGYSRATGARSFPDRLPASRVRSESQLGQAAGGSEKSTLELLRSDTGRMNRSASSESINERVLSDQIRPSASVDRMAEGMANKLVGRLANSEMAARRLAFLMSRLQLLLGLSSKESCKAFFYSSVASLQWTQRLMLRLWTYLISHVDSMHFRYQPAVFETLALLMLRGELDCSAMLEAPTSLLERYRRALWATTSYVVSKLSHKAAPTEVRVFCSQALATTFYRLPSLRNTVLTAILPIGESRHKHVREWNLPWSLQKASLAEAEVADETQMLSLPNPQRASWLARQYNNSVCCSPAQSSLSSVGGVITTRVEHVLGASATAPELSSVASVATRSGSPRAAAERTAAPRAERGVAPGSPRAVAESCSPRLVGGSPTKRSSMGAPSHGKPSSPVRRRSTDPAATLAAMDVAANNKAVCANASMGATSATSTGGGRDACGPISLGAAALAHADAAGGDDPDEQRSKSLEKPAQSGAGARSLDQWTQLWRMRLDSSSNATDHSTLNGRYWRERMHKRGHCFFLFAEHWVRHTSMAMGMQPGEELVWKEVPGFPTLIKAFLIEMKQRPLHMWPESMISCMCALLKENRQLLQVIVRILLARVSPLHLRPCLAVLQHLDAAMSAIHNDPLPQAFSPEPLLQTLHTLAESEHFKVVASALIFMYNHLDALGDAARLESLCWLHQRFAAFSLHWSRVVRTIFFHIYIIKVLHWTPLVSASPARRSVSTDLDNLFTASSGEIEKLLSRERVRGGGNGNGNGNGHGDYNGHGHGLAAAGNGEGNGKRDHRGRCNSSGSCGNGSSSSSLHSMLPHSASLNSMRDVEHLLEFHRVRDLYADSFTALEKLTRVAAAAQPLSTSSPQLRLLRNGSSPGIERRAVGVARAAQVATPPPKRVAPSGGGSPRVGTPGSPALDEALETQLAEACEGLGLGAPGSAKARRALGCVSYAWAEYEQVVRKWEAATAAAKPIEEAHRFEGLRDGSGATIGKSASTGMLGAHDSPIRRSNSEPSMTPAQPNALSLSLSMISANLHDDDDDAGAEPEEW